MYKLPVRVPWAASMWRGRRSMAAESLKIPTAACCCLPLAPLPCLLQVFTCGDIGHPASELRKRFPQLEGQLSGLPELWWHCPPDKPNCAQQKCFGSHESKDQVVVSSLQLVVSGEPGPDGGWSEGRGKGTTCRRAPAGSWGVLSSLSAAALPKPAAALPPLNPLFSPRPSPAACCVMCGAALQARIGAFRRWLQERPESVIVAVGHSSYWRSFEEVCRGTKPAHMRNCEFRLVHF